ncbi:MAG: sulfotransferase [Roseibium sp.]|uniref:sulfotransferase family protein n=1 Tax=Roseibium sp. TaxID=1936156 RepID=UPI0026201676|nr:sulfotransferase [Roseibium sp.]MCV0427183.1 sulfotransferase [Roseibium sp.]
MNEKNIIFLICNHRSGSTMLQQILGAHSDIGLLASPWFLFSVSYGLRDLDSKNLGISAEYNADVANKNLHAFLGNFENGEDLYYEAAGKFALHLYEQAIKHTGRDFFLDKNIRYHMIYHQMARILPEAKYLLLVRNPAAQFAGLMKWFGEDVSVLKGRRSDLFDAYENIKNLYVSEEFKGYRIRYEDFVAAPSDGLKLLYEYLELPYQNTLFYGNAIKEKTDTEISGFGDVTSLRKNNEPNSDYISKWVGYLDTDKKKFFARKWMDWAGPELFTSMGYDYEKTYALIPTDFEHRAEYESAWKELIGDVK